MSVSSLNLTMTPKTAPEWNTVLRGGFLVHVPGPVRLSDLLRKQLGLEYEYVQERVATIFVNGKPVDDADAAYVGKDCIVALAGFMPGIAGITMRRNSPVAAMRCQITYGEYVEMPDEPGYVTVRLFSTVALEAGPDVLARGIFLRRADLADFLSSRDGLFLSGVISAEFNGAPVDPARLASLRTQDLPDLVRLVVKTT